MEEVNQSRDAISGCRSCKDQGLGFRVQGLGFRVHHIRFFVDCFLKFCFLCCCSFIVFLFLFLFLRTGWSVQWTSAECNDLWLVMGLTNLVLKHFLKAWFYCKQKICHMLLLHHPLDLQIWEWENEIALGICGDDDDQVNPQCNYKGEEAQVMAANAASRSKLEQVHVSESLSAALKGCSMVSKGVIDCRFSFISPPADLHPNRVFFFFGFLVF